MGLFGKTPPPDPRAKVSTIITRYIVFQKRYDGIVDW